MTNPITPEVRAAIERYRNRPGSGQNIGERVADAALILEAMLSLFPPGMPEPVEMFQCDKGEESTCSLGRYEAFSDRQTAADFQRCTDMGKPYRGLFVPLERVEA